MNADRAATPDGVTVAPDVLLSLRDVGKVYRMGEVDVPALRDATLEIRDGELLVVAGPSGSGKSTLLNLIGGMDRPTSGEIFFGELALHSASPRELMLYRRHQVGFVFQFYNLIPTLTALENVQVAVHLARDPIDPMEALGQVGLAARAGHFPAQLSGGEQQRVAIARALAGNPRLILCDEPTGALDRDSGRQVLALLVRLGRELGRTVILITHNNAIARIGDRVARIGDGRIESVEPNDPPLAVEQVSW